MLTIKAKLAATILGVATATVLITGCTGGTPADDVAPSEFNQVDVMFAQMMVPHHDDAIAMSDYLQEIDGVDPPVEKLAEGIEAAQRQENTEMNSWLSQRGYPKVEQSPTQINEEAVASDSASAAEKQFLTEMIAHHQHGVEMAQGAADRGKSPVMTDLAQGMVQDQGKEIELMGELLAKR